MKVGVLTMLKHEFLEFKRNNKGFECTHIIHVNQLIGFTADMYVRVKGWERLSSKILNVVKAQEQLRELNKTNVIEPLPKTQFNTIIGKALTGRFASGGITQAINSSIQGKHADKIFIGNTGDSWRKAWENTPSFFPNMNVTQQVRPQLRCHTDDMADSLRGLGMAAKDLNESLRKSAMAFSTNFEMKISKEDIKNFIGNDLAGMP